MNDPSVSYLLRHPTKKRGRPKHSNLTRREQICLSAHRFRKMKKITGYKRIDMYIPNELFEKVENQAHLTNTPPLQEFIKIVRDYFSKN